MSDIPNTWEGISAYAKRMGAKYPDLVAAQWALESGFGKHFSGKNNVFGLKGPGSSRSTSEFLDGRWVEIKDDFIDFPTLAACVEYLVTRWYKDYGRLHGINHARNQYEGARMLREQGYATDPDYPHKLSRLLKAYSSPANSSASMIGPKKKPQAFGFKDGDHHIIVNDAVETAKCFNSEGKLLWELPALARGQGSDYEWKLRNTDTPPGLYKVGTVYRDYDINGDKPAFDRTLMAYGWYSLDLIDLEGQETGVGRAGIMLHGGGSANGWPGAWAPMQKLYATHGCVRMHNAHLRDFVMPLLKTGSIFISVYQEG